MCRPWPASLASRWWGSPRQKLDLDVAPGTCLAILGPNGAGKSTLLKVLLGLLPLSAGTITIDGRPPRHGSAEAGYVAQQRVFDPDLPGRPRDRSSRRAGLRRCADRAAVGRAAAADADRPGPGGRAADAAV